MIGNILYFWSKLKSLPYFSSCCLIFFLRKFKTICSNVLKKKNKQNSPSMFTRQHQIFNGVILLKPTVGISYLFVPSNRSALWNLGHIFKMKWNSRKLLLRVKFLFFPPSTLKTFLSFITQHIGVVLLKALNAPVWAIIRKPFSWLSKLNKVSWSLAKQDLDVLMQSVTLTWTLSRSVSGNGGEPERWGLYVVHLVFLRKQYV